MKALKDQTKEELLQTVTEVIERVNTTQIKLDSFEALHTEIFVGFDEEPSLNAKLRAIVDQTSKQSQTITDLKNKIVNYNNELFEDAESKLSLKTNMDNYYKEIKDSFAAIDKFKNSITEYNNELFKDIEGKVSVKKNLADIAATIESDGKKIAELKAGIETFANEVLVGTSDQESTKSRIEAILAANTAKINEFLAYHKKIFVGEGGKIPLKDEYETAYEEIVAAHSELITGDPKDIKSKPIKTQIIELQNTARALEAEVASTLTKLQGFQKEVFDTSIDEEGEEQPGLKRAAENLEIRLGNLIQQATDKLHALTDSSLHNSFYSRAEKYSKEYAELQEYTFSSVFAICGVTVLFAVIQLINVFFLKKEFSYNLEIYQLGITLPIVYAVWMFNRNQKIAKKLAEEYHHKAALAEAMTGYRALYQLEHNSPEYMNLFNSIKEQLNNNPSTTIDRFLNLKSPTEALVKESGKLVDTESIASVAGKITGK